MVVYLPVPEHSPSLLVIHYLYENVKSTSSDITNLSEIFKQQIDRQPKAIAIASLLVGLIAMSCAGIFIRLSEGELSPNATIFNRCWIAFVVLGLWFSLKRGGQKQQDRYTRNDLLLLVAAGTFFWSWNILWAWSLARTSVANSTLLHSMTSLFACLGGWLFWGRHIDSKFAMGLVLALGGTFALEFKDMQVATDNFIGDTVALLSSIAYAGNIMLIERLREKLAAGTIIMWSCAIGTVLCLPIFLITGDRLLPPSWQGWLFVIGLAMVSQVLGQGLAAYSLKILSSAFVTLLDLLEPIFAAIAAWAIFSESLSLSNWIAFAVVLSGLYLASSSKSAVK